jgi:hypothetical protein
MKNIYYILTIILLSSFTFQLKAQQIDENTAAINQYFQTINSQVALTDGIAVINSQSSNKNLPQNSESNIIQTGNYNYINVKTNTNNINASQIGNNNSYEFISYYGRNDLNFDILQVGNNNLIQVFGENNIINNMTIIQKSNFKTITITNY